MTTPYGSPRGKAGVSRVDSTDELTSFFRLLASQLSQPPDEVISRMKEDEITVEDLAHMNKKDLYDYGIQTFSDAKLILQHARNHGQLVRQRSGSQGNRGTEGQLARQDNVPQRSTDTEALLQKKLIDVPPSLRDVFAAHLDAKLDGVPSWEQFGEKLLNMDATDLRQFQARDSPTKAILNKKVATDPSATLEDAFRALEAIGRKDVTELVLKEMGTTTTLSSKQESFDRSTPSPLHFSYKLPLVHQSSSTDSDYGTTKQDSTLFKHSTLVQSENSSAQHTQHVAIVLDSDTHHMPLLTQSDNIKAYPPSTFLPKQSSVEQPKESSTADSQAQVPEQQNVTEELRGLLKAMTTDDSHQEIHIACRVYNATTNQLITGEAPLLRDITITPRFQSISPSSITKGTEIRLEVTVDVPSYLYVLNIGTSGSTTMLLPNQHERNNFFRANQTYHFPGKDYGFEIQGPPGREVIQVMAFTSQQDTLRVHSGCAIQKEPLLRDIHILQSTSQEKRHGFAQVEFTVT